MNRDQYTDVEPHASGHGEKGLDPVQGRLLFATDAVVADPTAGDLIVANSDSPSKWAVLPTGAAGTVFIGGSTFSVNLLLSGYGRVGATTGLTGATTAGDWTAKRFFVEDAVFNFAIASSNPTITFDTNDTLSYNRASNFLGLAIGSTAVMQISATYIRHKGYLSLLADPTAAPANATAGDLTALRAHIGTDGAFTSGKELEVVGDALVSATFEVGTTSHLIGKVTADGAMDVAGKLAAAAEVQIGGDLNHDGANIGLFGVAPAARQTLTALTNNVTSGGTADTLADYTDLIVYANDAAAIRNDIYRLGQAIIAIRNVLLPNGYVQ